MTTRGSRVMFRPLIDDGPVPNQTARPSHTPQTGIACGRPSSRTVASQ
jgi:hypothetical protein